MSSRAAVAFHKLAAFTIALLLALCLYLLLHAYYGEAVLTVSGWLLRPFVEAPVTVFNSAQKGILLASPAFRGLMQFRYDLFSIGLNLIFAPALVIMTVGWKGRSWIRIAASIVVMLFLHACEVTVTFLRFLTEHGNPLIPMASSAYAAAAKWIYTFFDKMGYTLFPFIAWLVVCAGTLSQGLMQPVYRESGSEAVRRKPEGA